MGTAGAADPARQVRPGAWAAVWGVGVLAYVLAVMQRTTLGAAGLDAAARFGISPGALSLFVFLQVAVYVALQIPAGVLVDRWGSRVVLVLSGLLLAAGQALLAVAPSLAFAAMARVLVGSGDALVFVSVLALVPRWFPARRVPLATQLTTILGQVGQVLSAVPFLALLHGAGWSPAFGIAAAASGAIALLALCVVRDASDGARPAGATVTVRETARELAAVWKRPGTRLGFFGHMGTQFSMMVFSLLWGVPYLVSGQGLSTATAGLLVTLLVVGTLCAGPVVGMLTARHPLRRSWLLLAVIAADVVVWTAILLLPGPAPLWLLVVLVLVLSVGGPGSVVGFDIARTANPRANLALAQSMVNLGGFLATLLVLALMGALMTASGGFGPESFRIAWLVQYPVWAAAVTGVLVARRKARRLDADRGIRPRPLREVFARV